MKPCRLCGVAKPLGNFYLRTSSRDGHRSECKACSIARSTVRQKSPACAAYRRRYYEAHRETAKAAARAAHWANREQRLAAAKVWYRAHIEEERKKGIARATQWAIANPERARAKGRKTRRRQRLLHPDLIKAAKARDYTKNRQKRLDKTKDWRQRNPDRVHANGMKSKHRRRSRLASVVVEHIDRRIVFARDGWLCGICKLPVAKADASIDHVIPIAKGGQHTYANCQTAHLKCNISKGAKLQEPAA